MATIMITGGTGTVGKRLTEILLEKRHSVIIVGRSGNPKQPPKDDANSNNLNLTYAQWNIDAQSIDEWAIQQADYIIHLAGAGVADKRWSDARKKEIADSRINSCALIVKALSSIPNKVKGVISASAIGWYGPDNHDGADNVEGGELTAGANKIGFTEEANPYPDFLGNTCKAWEDSIAPVTTLGKRLVILRTGIVLSNEGGALVEFKKPLLFKTAAILGSGNQMISWIHVDDLCNQYIYAIENEQMNGVYNAVAPNPVSNKTLTIELAKKICGSFYIPFYVPAFVLKIVLGEMSIEVLKSATVSSSKIENAGFQFAYPTIDAALQALTHN
ncbi:TIGR01777 family oxidoreductase [Sediminibacterium sp.]|uniref:TIGR01777 family oxidoreductase n=1 Tax=Sediminibacterium sp. TaxID=1917865 RepID=UPI000BCA4DB3|nr:TIGR01777 family oxidoreductase [Sediminibacterium sp.]MDP3392488.1 TIGR01777 family oxidoreductase [Sediminibacterium sp.]MDP3565754.1 TIGR01777 family oxidoreductase [Sediminibacterium sp.]OYZ00938.1 MAG: TIGR01777 family protein [Sphingobacteriia bacterium 28-36-52]